MFGDHWQNKFTKLRVLYSTFSMTSIKIIKKKIYLSISNCDKTNLSKHFDNNNL